MLNLTTMKANIVQAIRAYRVEDLQATAVEQGHHFLYASLAGAQQRQDVLDLLGEQFKLPEHYGKNFDALHDCLTDPIYKSGEQKGFVVVIENIPCNARFDRDVREQLIDVLREVADYWGDRKIPFRCFYSFAVGRSTKVNGCDDAGKGAKTSTGQTLIDVSPLALRMSSPFNAGYWLAAAEEDEEATA